jgi:hypothetical protein
LELRFKVVPILHDCTVCYIQRWVHIRADDRYNPFFGVSAHERGGEHDFIDVVNAFAFQVEVSVELEDPYFQLSAISKVEFGLC